MIGLALKTRAVTQRLDGTSPRNLNKGTPLPTPQPTHLVSVWNPTYADDALNAHTSLLVTRLREAHWSDNWDDAYVWWGKVRSSHRQQRMPHLDDILALGEVLLIADAPETHLYLTDYRSLYVAEVGAITADDQAVRDPAHVPDYYRREGLHCDCWFMLLDIRRLVSDDLPSVIDQLRALRNTRYHDQPVSIYGGMVEVPLLVSRPDGRSFFDPDEVEVLTGGRKWVEFDAESGGLGAMERELRENLLGESIWSRLDAGSRTFLAAAEKIFRDHRYEPGFDLSPALTNLAKAVEVETNLALRRGLANAPAPARHYNRDGSSIDLASAGHLSLNDLARAIGGDRARAEWLTQTAGGWFAGQLPAVLDGLRDDRNPGAHSANVDRVPVTRWRNRILGVGCDAVIGQIASAGRA